MMNKTIFLTLFFFLTSMFAFSQDFSSEFGSVGKGEIELKEYSLDKDAEAVVLFDLGKSYFVESEGSYDIIFERTTRIKILSESGIKWAEVEIPFYQEGEIYEKVYDIEASAYNTENSGINKSDFDASNTFVEKINDNWSVRKFAVPNARKGSVIEYRYKIRTQYKFNFRDWEFQWRIPVVYSEYEVKLVPFYEYSFILQGAKKFDVFQSYEDKTVDRYFGSQAAYATNIYHDAVYKYGMKNVPAFSDEEFITSINDYIIKIDFQLSKLYRPDNSASSIITTWEELIKDLLKHQDFGSYISKSEKLAPKLFDIGDISQKTETEKFNDIIDYVKSNYNWNKFADKYASKSPKNLVEDKYGNCADINLFTIGLLNSVGINASAIILSTRDHGKIKAEYPFSHYFNYVIVMADVDGKTIIADATEAMGMNNRIPPRCLNGQGLIIQKDKVEWINMETQVPSGIITFMEININNDNLLVDLSMQGTEYDALNFRKKYSNKIDFIREKIADKNYTIIDSTISIYNQPDREKPFKLRYSFTTKADIVNNKIYISPFLNESISDNPLKQVERRYPVDIVYPIKRAYSCVLTIPEGYQVDFVPTGLTINNELFDVNYTIKASDNNLLITFDYYFKRYIYQPGDYLRIKNAYNDIVKKGNEKIVLVKKM